MKRATCHVTKSGNAGCRAEVRRYKGKTRGPCAPLRESEAGEEVAELVFLGAQVGAREEAGARTAGNSLDDPNAGVFELLYFVGIVREQAGGADAKSLQRLGGKLVVARIGGDWPRRCRVLRPEVRTLSTC